MRRPANILRRLSTPLRTIAYLSDCRIRLSHAWFFLSLEGFAGVLYFLFPRRRRTHPSRELGHHVPSQTTIATAAETEPTKNLPSLACHGERSRSSQRHSLRISRAFFRQFGRRLLTVCRPGAGYPKAESSCGDERKLGGGKGGVAVTRSVGEKKAFFPHEHLVVCGQES